MVNDIWRRTRSLLTIIAVGATLVLPLTHSTAANGQPQGCLNADGKLYGEGSRLGPFVCRNGHWIYVGD